VRLQGLGKLKKSSDIIGNRTRGLPPCSIVPQTTSLQRAPFCQKKIQKFRTKKKRRGETDEDEK
jgi:hypothetical protein